MESVLSLQCAVHGMCCMSLIASCNTLCNCSGVGVMLGNECCVTSPNTFTWSWDCLVLVWACMPVSMAGAKRIPVTFLRCLLPPGSLYWVVVVSEYRWHQTSNGITDRLVFCFFHIDKWNVTVYSMKMKMNIIMCSYCCVNSLLVYSMCVAT